MKSPVTVNGTTTYPYLGGCNAWEFLYADASGNVYSIGYNLTDDTGPSYVYPQPELLVKKTLHVGETWHESLGPNLGTETATVGTPVEIDGGPYIYKSWPITYNDVGLAPNTVWYAVGVGPTQVTDFCTQPSMIGTLEAYNP